MPQTTPIALPLVCASKRPRKEIDLKEWYCTDDLLQRIGEHNTGLTFLQVHRGRDQITDAGSVAMEGLCVNRYSIDSFYQKNFPFSLSQIHFPGCSLVGIEPCKLLEELHIAQATEVSQTSQNNNFRRLSQSNRPVLFVLNERTDLRQHHVSIHADYGRRH